MKGTQNIGGGSVTTFTPTLTSNFTLASWGYVRGLVSGKICIVSASGLRATSALTQDTPAMSIPYIVAANTATQTFDDAGKRAIVSVTGGQDVVKLNNTSANSNMYFQIVFMVQ